jgi:hypothetical protein
MIPYYFAPPKLRLWVAGGCSLDFCFVLHQGKMKNKPTGALEKTNIKTQLPIRETYNFFRTFVLLKIIELTKIKISCFQV